MFDWYYFDLSNFITLFIGDNTLVFYFFQLGIHVVRYCTPTSETCYYSWIWFKDEYTVWQWIRLEIIERNFTLDGGFDSYISYFVRLVNCLNVINTWDWYDYSAIPIIFFTLLMTYFWISFSKGTRAWEKKIALHCIWKVHCLVVPSNTYVRLCMIKKKLSPAKCLTRKTYLIWSRLWNQDPLHSSMGHFFIVKSIITFHTHAKCVDGVHFQRRPNESFLISQSIPAKVWRTSD